MVLTASTCLFVVAFEAIFEGGHSIGFFYRELLQQSKNFDATLPLLQQTHMDSPSYVLALVGATYPRELNIEAAFFYLHLIGARIGLYMLSGT